MKCPKCKSPEVHAEKRGWRLLSGFIGSGKIILTCLNCGKQFRPGEQLPDVPDALAEADTALGNKVLLYIVLIGLAVGIVYSFVAAR